MGAAVFLPVLPALAVAGVSAFGGGPDVRRREVFEYCQDVSWSFDRDGTPTADAAAVSAGASAGETPRTDPDRSAFERAGGRCGDAEAFFRWMDAERSVAGESAFVAGWDDGGVFVLSERGSGIRCLKRYDVRGGSAACLTPTNGAHDLLGPIWFPDGAGGGGRPAGVCWRTERGTSNEWSDARMAAAERRLSETFPGVRPEWIAPSPADRLRWIVRCRFPEKPPVWADVDAGAGTVRVLSRFPEPSGGMVRRVFRWRASDGTGLCGVVSFPSEGGPFPLVVFPHGGPGAISDEPFDERAWALVDAGFAVLQPNYRGSVGFGKAFRFAGWGPDGLRRALDDVHEASVAAQADETLPIAKTKPVLLGGSWGGWCVLEELARHPDSWAGGVSFFGAFDLPELVRSEAARIAGGEPSEADRELRTLFRQFGDPADAKTTERLAELSPARHADAIAAPVVLFHDREDAVIPFEQSETMFAALTNAGRRAEFRVGAGGHGFSAAEEARVYGELAALFHSWIGPDPAAEPERRDRRTPQNLSAP